MTTFLLEKCSSLRAFTLQVPVLPLLLLVGGGKARQVWPQRTFAEAFLLDFIGMHQLLSLGVVSGIDHVPGGSIIEAVQRSTKSSRMNGGIRWVKCPQRCGHGSE